MTSQQEPVLLGTMKLVGAKSARFSARLMSIIGMRFSFPIRHSSKITDSDGSLLTPSSSPEVPAHLVTKIIQDEPEGGREVVDNGSYRQRP